MKTTLIKLQDKFILVSEEEQMEGDFIIHKTLLDKIHKTPDKYGSTQEHWYKIIAGIPELPSIDFSLLSEEDCKTIGWVDVEKLAREYAKIHPTKDIDEEERYYNSNCKYYDAYKEGFKTAQSLNDKQFSLEDIEKAMIEGLTIEKFWEKCIQSLQQTSWDVEVEMESYFTDECERNEGVNDGENIEKSFIPKITNNSVKVFIVK